MRPSISIRLLALSLLSLAAPIGVRPNDAVDPLDWPSWRGPEMNGISRETGIVDRWSPQGENLLWANPELATRSTPIHLRGKLYLLARDEPGTLKEGEKVICADAATGKKLWENRFKVFLSDVPDTRVGWSNVVGDPETGRIYALGVCGYFQCLDGDTGKTLWAISLSEQRGLLSTYGGRTNVPILFEDLVIISAVMTGWGDNAIPHHRFLAFDKITGKPVWDSATRPRPDDTTYSTPVVGVLGGQQAMVFGSGDGGVYAFQPRTGKLIWQYMFSLRGINVTPLLDGDTVYCAHSEENLGDNTMGAVAAIKGVGKGDITKTNTQWFAKEALVGKSSPLLVDGRLYVIDDGAGMFIYDAARGKLLGKQKLGTMFRASPLYADGKIFCAEATGRWAILQPTEKGVKIIHRLKLPGEIHGSPILSHGRLFVPTTENFYCVGKKDQKPSATPAPKPALENPIDDQTPATLLVTPVESLIGPGDRVDFAVRLFNARGQRLADQSATYSVDGGGTIGPGGSFQADSAPSHHAAIISAKVGSLVGKARVRIVPPLPWSFDFSDGQVPVTWIGARARHVVRDDHGEKVLVKVTTIPKGTRSQSWMGPDHLHDYTIQADVKGAIKDGKQPDIGLIAQRYTLDMMGASQQIQIRFWTPLLEKGMSKSVPFKWEPNQWYTMKFQAENAGDDAILRGKVWARDSTEPSEWTIEHRYPAPSRAGSPGLFGNAQFAEIFLDNVKVTPNGSH